MKGWPKAKASIDELTDKRQMNQGDSSFSARLRRTWGYFIPAWILPFYFLNLKHIDRLIGEDVTVIGFFVLLLSGVAAVRAKKLFGWAEFYLLWLALPMAVLLFGFCFLVVMAQF